MPCAPSRASTRVEARRGIAGTGDEPDGFVMFVIALLSAAARRGVSRSDASRAGIAARALGPWALERRSGRRRALATPQLAQHVAAGVGFLVPRKNERKTRHHRVRL